MEIHFIIKCLAVIGFLSVYNVEAQTHKLIRFDLLDFYRLNNSHTVFVELQSTWSSWFRNTYINNRSNPEYVAKFKEDDTLMFVLNSTDQSTVMLLLDSDGKEVAVVYLDSPPYYRMFIHRGSLRESITLDAFEHRFTRNNYKSFDSNAEQFLIDFINPNTKTLNEIKTLGKVCTVRSPILTWEWCSGSEDVGTFSDYDIDICIITSLTDEKKIKFYDLNGLLNSKFDIQLETVVVIHGYQVWPFTSGHDLIKLYQEAYFGDGTRRLNLIGIDWTNDMPIDYPRATYRVKDVGVAVGNLLSEAIKYNLMRPKDIYLVGHSLGAHIAGFIGKTMKSVSHNLPRLITALDPARPLFRGEPCAERVCKFDADWVEILHSNAGVWGYQDDIGDSDFYLNGGSFQPGCSYLNEVCHHTYAHQFHRKLLTHQEHLNAWRCQDQNQMNEEKECVRPCNPRRLFAESLPLEAGVFYVPYPAIDESDIPVESMNMSLTQRPKGKPKSVTFFGANEHNVDVLADLLIADSNKYIRHAERFNITGNLWTTQSNAIKSHLDKLPKPIRFVLTVDYTDLFQEDFWKILKFIAEDRTYHSELVVVAMNIPYVKGPLYQHVDEIKDIIQRSDTKKLLGSFEIRGLHEIKQSAIITEIPNLWQELSAIKSIVGIN